MALHLKSTGLDYAGFGNVGGMDSELISDFEEGTYSPTLVGQTGATGQTYSGQNGCYMKIGRWICINSYSTLSTEGTITGGYPAIGGIPFTAANSGQGGLDSGGCGVSRVEQIKISQTWVGPHVQVGSGNYFLMMEAAATGSASVSHRACGASYNAPQNAYTNDTSLAVLAWYRAAS